MRLHSFEAFKAGVDPDDANLEVPLVWTLSLSVPRLLGFVRDAFSFLRPGGWKA